VVPVLFFTPIAKVKPEGRLAIAGGLFGKRRVPERFAGYVARQVAAGHRWRLIVGHCDARADGEILLAELTRRLDCQDAWLVDTGPAIGAHAGPGALVVSLQPADV